MPEPAAISGQAERTRIVHELLELADTYQPGSFAHAALMEAARVVSVPLGAEDEDPRVTAARRAHANVRDAIHGDPDPHALAWTPEAIATRHNELYAALTQLLAYIDGEG